MIFNDMNLSRKQDTTYIIVTITGRNTTIQYDGQSHSIENYNVVVNDPAYTINDFTFSGTAYASGTDVGTYSMGLSAEQFENINPRYQNVEFQVTDGFIRVTGKYVTVAADAKSKTYDGDPDTDPALTVTVNGLVGSDTITYSVSRAQGQNVLRDSDNVVTGYAITPTGDTVQGNYIVSYSTAKFTINPASVTVKADDKSKTYGGSDPVFTATVTGLIGSDTVAYTLSRATGENAGSYAITPTGQAIQGNYVVSYQSGSLTINPVAVTLTANSGTKVYNGSQQSVSGFASSIAGLSFTGVSASGSGKNANTYSVTFTGVTIDVTTDTTGNYVVTNTVNGTLTITKRTVARVTITGHSASFPYDESSHTVSGYDFSSSDVLYTRGMCTVTGDSVSRTEVGSASMNISAVNNNNNFTVTDFVIVNGSITITEALKIHITWPAGLSVALYNGNEPTERYLFSDVSGTHDVVLTDTGLYTAVSYQGNMNQYYGSQSLYYGMGSVSVDSIDSSVNINVPYPFTNPKAWAVRPSGYIYDGITVAMSDMPFATKIPVIKDKWICYLDPTGPGYYSAIAISMNTGTYTDNKYIYVCYENLGDYEEGDIDNCLSFEVRPFSPNPGVTYNILADRLIPLTGKSGILRHKLTSSEISFSDSYATVSLAARNNAKGVIHAVYVTEE